MALAFVLFGIDLLTPSHGVLTIGGLIAFALGSMLLINHGDPVFQIAPSVIIGVVLSLAAFFLFVTTVVLRDFHRRPVTGREGLVGAIAITRSRLAPRGTVFVEGELWQATSQSGTIEIGQPVRVVAVDGLSLRVAADVPAGKEQPA
jgi:membrane-bound serine protease (ClpP class)